MPRGLRENLENGAYHVYARGNNKALIYRDQVDREVYLRGLCDVTSRYEMRCLSYCLMDNHVHLLMETPRANLSSAMQWFHGCYAQQFNLRHSRSGHLFQGRYGASRIKSDVQLCATAAYIARNPIEAGLCDEPDGWEWSSYASTVEGSHPGWLAAGRLLEFFGSRSAFDEMIRWRPARV